MRPWLLRASLAAGVLTCGCSSEQLYRTGQGVQRNQCTNKLDPADYERCMRNADVPYDVYKRENTPEKK